MFQRFTSLFFSDSSTAEGLEEPKPFVSEEEEEDGWLIIELGEEPGPDGVGSSPMEDLLIEHPSMSVYVTSTLELDAEVPQDDAAGEVPEPQLERHVPHRSTSLSVKAAVLEKVSQARRVQRAKQLAEKPWLSQKALQRQDRALGPAEKPHRRNAPKAPFQLLNLNLRGSPEALSPSTAPHRSVREAEQRALPQDGAPRPALPFTRSSKEKALPGLSRTPYAFARMLSGLGRGGATLCSNAHGHVLPQGDPVLPNALHRWDDTDAVIWEMRKKSPTFSTSPVL
ncbi:tumor protein p53-inducible nuclear protein 2 [Meleagris gallopavo]|uniref:tumor protein p53-inducible nuclear protein 2 n=1 Tax=Meleagris gallopavo TaxID=9103 RepID=UPI000549C4AB|nr:tumor protein p53-inducible nuclear protein 2 [Meleagris gallopavo]